MRILPSVHDVMPHTLPRVRELLQGPLSHLPPERLPLLVVPGLDWDTAGLDQLRRWSDAGHPLAGHGWVHQVSRYGGLYHRLHAAVLSRDVAEHLALDADEILALMHRCHAWFGAHDLPVAPLYVPPAWALGAVPPERLHEQPFAWVECFAGWRRADSGALTRLSVIGYEARRINERLFLGAWNAGQWRRHRNTPRPLRVSIHPYDHQLRLRNQFARHMNRAVNPVIGWDALAAEY